MRRMEQRYFGRWLHTTAQCTPTVVPHRFALWTLRAADHATPEALLLHDRELLATLPAPPVARMLLPIAGPSALFPLAYAHGAHTWSALELVGYDLQCSSDGHFALSLLSPAPRTLTPDDQLRAPDDRPTGAIATRLLISNARVNVWDFYVEPQRTCALHEHVLPYVFINRSSGATRNLDAQLHATGDTLFNAGECRFVDVQTHKQRCIHAFENIGATALQQYVIEFKQ